MTIRRSTSFLFLMAVFALPLSQQLFSWARLVKLHGDVRYASDTVLTWRGWLNESFQKKKDAWVNDSFGFRSEFVRLHNQLRYSLFGLPGAQAVVVGKAGYLYEENYIKAVTGDDLLDTQTINRRCDAVAHAARILQQENILLLVILAPGKGSYYPEFIPERYGSPAAVTNYSLWSDGLQKRHVNLLDFYAWFRSMKDTSRFPLYPKTGVHWSQYGVCLAMDSTVRFLERRTGEDCPEIRWDSIERTRSPRYDDKDIEDGMNLLFPLDHLEMAYPNMTVAQNGKARVPVLTIADSYYWQWFGSGVAGQLFNPAEVWYYFEEAHVSGSQQPPKKIADVPFLEKILQQRVIILLSTDANLSRFDYGFCDRLIREFSSSGANGFNEALLKKQMDDIRHSPDWYKQVIEKAITKGISVDSMLKLDAQWVLDQKARQ